MCACFALLNGPCRVTVLWVHAGACMVVCRRAARCFPVLYTLKIDGKNGDFTYVCLFCTGNRPLQSYCVGDPCRRVHGGVSTRGAVFSSAVHTELRWKKWKFYICVCKSFAVGDSHWCSSSTVDVLVGS